MQQLNVMPTLEIGEAELWRQQTNRMAKQSANEAGCEIEAQSVCAIGWDNDHGVFGGCLVRQPDMHVTRYVADDQFASVGVRTLRQDRPQSRWIEWRAAFPGTPRRRQDQRAGGMFRKPEYGFVDGGAVRVVGKTATPIGGRDSIAPGPDRRRPVRSDARCGHSRGDRRCFDGEVRRRSRGGRDGSVVRSSPATASRIWA